MTQHSLTFNDRSKGGTNNWLLHERRPPGRKKLPRLSSMEGKAAGPRGGFKGRKTIERRAPSGTSYRFS